jgi:hypothetical protein
MADRGYYRPYHEDDDEDLEKEQDVYDEDDELAEEEEDLVEDDIEEQRRTGASADEINAKSPMVKTGSVDVPIIPPTKKHSKRARQSRNSLNINAPKPKHVMSPIIPSSLTVQNAIANSTHNPRSSQPDYRASIKILRHSISQKCPFSIASITFAQARTTSVLLSRNSIETPLPSICVKVPIPLMNSRPRWKHS